MTVGLKEAMVSWLSNARSLEELEQWRNGTLGKYGIVPQTMKMLGSMAADERRGLGMELNNVRNDLVAAYEVRRKQLEGTL